MLITHEHGDHVKPEFVSWLLDRGDDVTVFSNQSVADLLAQHDITVETANPADVSAEDVLHETTPMGTAPPNRSYTIDGVLTHPGDSYQPTWSAPVLALPLLIPCGSTTASMDFARRLAPQQAIPIHDFYLNGLGHNWITEMAKNVLAKSGIERLVDKILPDAPVGAGPAVAPPAVGGSSSADVDFFTDSPAAAGN